MNGLETQDGGFLKRTQTGVPRKFAIGTLLIITAIYCVLMRALLTYDGIGPSLLLIPMFVTFVGVAQAVLFKGRHPREASMLAGAIAGLLASSVILVSAFYRMPYALFLGYAIGALLYAMLIGTLLGYGMGLLLAGVFYVARGRKNPQAPVPEVIQSTTARDGSLNSVDRFLIRCLALPTMPFRPGRPGLEFAGMAAWCALITAPVTAITYNPFGIWGLQAAYGAIVFSLTCGIAWAGIRATSRKSVVILAVLGLIGGLLMGWLCRNVTLSVPVDWLVELKLFAGAGLGISAGLVIAGACGWLSWLLSASVEERWHNRIPLVGVAALGCLFAVGASFLLRAAKHPREEVLRNLPPSVTVASLRPSFLFLSPTVDRVALGKAGTDELLGQLHWFEELTYCDLSWAQVTDAGIKRLQDCVSIRHLSLNDTGIGDAAMANLSGGQLELSSLSIERTNVTGNGLAHLQQPKLGYLNLSGCDLSDSKALPAIAAMTELRHLDLSNTRISGPGIAQLTSLKNLETLIFSGTQVTNADVMTLATLKLTKLDVSETNVTLPGAGRLGKAMPWANISVKR